MSYSRAALGDDGNRSTHYLCSFVFGTGFSVLFGIYAFANPDVVEGKQCFIT